MEQPDLDLDVRRLPYELQEETPEEGVSLSEYYGVPQERVGSMQDGVRARAEELGMSFRTPEMLCNTRKAHILAEYAREKGTLDPLRRELFRANFVEGLNLADDHVLRHMAEQAGLDPQEAMAALYDPRYAAMVAAALQRARDIGITGVPTFIVDGKYRIVGAHPLEAMRDTLRRITATED